MQGYAALPGLGTTLMINHMVDNTPRTKNISFPDGRRDKNHFFSLSTLGFLFPVMMINLFL
jgi:hypothetical protein